MARTTLLGTLMFAVSLATGCHDAPPVEAEKYVDNMVVLSDDGAFHVRLQHEQGMAMVGANTFMIEISFPDSSRDMGEGLGISRAVVDLEAWMPNQAHALESAPQIHELGDGQYLIEDVVLDRAGVWELDFDIRVGTGVRESATFVFSVE